MADLNNFLPGCYPQQLSFVNAADLTRFLPSCHLQYVNAPVMSQLGSSRGNEEDFTDSGSISTLHTSSLNSRASGPAVVSTSIAQGVQGKILKIPGGCNVIKTEPPPVMIPQPATTATATRKDSALDPRKYKTHLCRNWLRTGVCAFAEGCVYAHGSQELRKESENISVLSLLEKLASQCKPPPTKEATLATDNVSRRKARRHSRRAKGKSGAVNHLTSKLEMVTNEENPQADGEEVIFELPLNGAVHIDTDDDDGTDSELDPSPNRHLSGDFSALDIHDLRKAVSLPVNEVESHRAALDAHGLTSHSFQPFIPQRTSVTSHPPSMAAAAAAAAAAMSASNQPTRTDTETELQKMSSIVKDSLVRIQTLENEVALLKSCLAELLKNELKSTATTHAPLCMDSTAAFPTSKPSAAMSNTMTHSFFNFQNMGNG